MAEKKKRFLTPIGFAKWAHLHTPKAPYKGEADRGAKYQIDVCFTPDDPAWKEWAGALKAAVEALPTQIDKRTGAILAKQMPIKRELNADDTPTGRFYVTFKTGEQFRPSVFDKYGQPVTDQTIIGNDSRVRIAYMPVEYEGFGGGIALYLNAVQVVDLVEYKGQSAEAYGFAIEAVPAGDPGASPESDPLPF
jgi:hypothetical protein